MQRSVVVAPAVCAADAVVAGPHERMNVASCTDVGRGVVEDPASSPLVTALTLGAVLGALFLLGVLRLWRADLPGRS